MTDESTDILKITLSVGADGKVSLTGQLLSPATDFDVETMRGTLFSQWSKKTNLHFDEVINRGDVTTTIQWTEATAEPGAAD